MYLTLWGAVSSGSPTVNGRARRGVPVRPLVILGRVSDPSPVPDAARAVRPVHRARTVAAVLCGLEAVALVAFAGFYVYELALGLGTDPARVVMSAVLIVLAAAGLAVLARGWLRWTRWPRTPTVVWHLLLVPVGWSVAQAGRPGLGAAVLAVALVALGAAYVAPRPDDTDADPV